MPPWLLRISKDPFGNPSSFASNCRRARPIEWKRALRCALYATPRVQLKALTIVIPLALDCFDCIASIVIDQNEPLPLFRGRRPNADHSPCKLVFDVDGTHAVVG